MSWESFEGKANGVGNGLGAWLGIDLILLNKTGMNTKILYEDAVYCNTTPVSNMSHCTYVTMITQQRHGSGKSHESKESLC